ncbi:MAG: hypothetical protein BGO98_02840 [Myxococcales bacterium 68-20]|nr:MAG: hypothetical protein BGO98_02840 [Myxococcales bacterium 68-20]
MVDAVQILLLVDGLPARDTMAAHLDLYGAHNATRWHHVQHGPARRRLSACLSATASRTR